MRKPFVTVVVIFLLGLAIGLVVNQQRGTRSAPVEKPAVKTVEPQVHAEDLELVQGSEGKELWRVRAQSAQYSLDQRIVQVVRPQLFAYIGAERDEVFIRSDTGEINQMGNTVTLRDNIAGRFGAFALTSDVFDYIGAMAHFIGHFQASFGKHLSKCSDEVMRVFMTYPWPGNVRELKYSLEHACILCPGGEITLAHLPADLVRFSKGQGPARLTPNPAPRHGQRAGLAREDISSALIQAGGNRAKAARLLGVDRRTLYRNMAKHLLSQ